MPEDQKVYANNACFVVLSTVLWFSGSGPSVKSDWARVCITLTLAHTEKLSRAYHRQGFDVVVCVKSYTHTHQTSLMLSSLRYNYRSGSHVLEIVPSILLWIVLIDHNFSVCYLLNVWDVLLLLLLLLLCECVYLYPVRSRPSPKIWPWFKAHISQQCVYACPSVCQIITRLRHQTLP